ncbi:hypothetical protein G6O67_008316 [Ophiocordyceps sinensis]|uniref:Coiled-coil domain-containing protein 174 n=1 Tax=Ophiocordyceps sinensis TaxID=72228 RepID=A0A8H4LTQ6_9HYPO|nr:hypothetical protein G6O67_008884 [Ophiocordyceps sinensis]KAF4504927.1 hypothetical protein G6O67_008316 [Ophiocordyceps sinensis]
MPQDPDLYGQRPAKRHKRATQDSTTPRPRPSKELKQDIFRSKRSAKLHGGPKDGSKLVLKDVAGTEEETRELTRAKRNMENKARLYEAMKRGDYVPKENEAEPLVDFDRKWAEGKEHAHSDSDSSSDEEDHEADKEVIEWDDEFGRRRHGTRADKDKMERRARRGMLGAEELEHMSARPSAPSKLIYGDTIQSMAFNPEAPEQMEALARKRDRSQTPPAPTHYDADMEIRTRGVAFFKFSKDEETRATQMQSLQEERERTVRERQRCTDQKETRKREIEQRRKDIRMRRARHQADSFLDRLTEGTTE